MLFKEERDWEENRALSYKMREHILALSTNGGCFTGASLSLVEVLVYLYKNFLHIPAPGFADRDYCLLSKGHDVPALYSLFVEMGWMPKERLKNHLSPEDKIYWHPNSSIPGVEFHSGSLGHLLSVGMGIAYDLGLEGSQRKVVVILGDGELNEGSIWEGCLVASALKLSNLLVVVDRNEFQANKRTEELIPLEPLANKFEAFGWKVKEAEGHDFDSLQSGFGALSGSAGPSVLIAHTVRGKGVPSIERKADKWFCNFSASEISTLAIELETGRGSGIEIEGRVVR